jgi:prevent-host-death family protein
MLMVKMNLSEAKARMAEVARLVKEGQEVVICERNRPIAKVVSLSSNATAPKRTLGLLRNQCALSEDFFSADHEIQTMFLNDGQPADATGSTTRKP